MPRLIRLAVLIHVGALTLIVLARLLGRDEPMFAALLRRDVTSHDRIACWIGICPGITPIDVIRRQLAAHGTDYGITAPRWVTDGHYVYMRWSSPDASVRGRITTDLRGAQWITLQIGLGAPGPPLNAGDMIRLFGWPERIAVRAAIEPNGGQMELVWTTVLCFRDGIAVTVRSAVNQIRSVDPATLLTLSGLMGEESCVARSRPWRGFGVLQPGGARITP